MRRPNGAASAERYLAVPQAMALRNNVVNASVSQAP
jgi:hypothetical protein